MQPNTQKYFPFPEMLISGKYVFSRKRFTATKHSLSNFANLHIFNLTNVGDFGT